MAKPEEVLIVEDENGNIVRETMKDNDVLVQYKVRCFCLHGGISWWRSSIIFGHRHIAVHETMAIWISVNAGG
jgi:predicted phosphodiesterase